jgi:hypothetical protein
LAYAANETRETHIAYPPNTSEPFIEPAPGLGQPPVNP